MLFCDAKICSGKMSNHLNGQKLIHWNFDKFTVLMLIKDVDLKYIYISLQFLICVLYCHNKNTIVMKNKKLSFIILFRSRNLPSQTKQFYQSHYKSGHTIPPKLLKKCRIGILDASFTADFCKLISYRKMALFDQWSGTCTVGHVKCLFKFSLWQKQITHESLIILWWKTNKCFRIFS